MSDEMDRLRADNEALRAELATPILVAVNRLVDALADERMRAARLRAVLEEIRGRDWVENALDPQWAAGVAGEALKREIRFPLTESETAARMAAEGSAK